jgi:hypothetical protein
MNWEVIASTGEWAGAAAVIASLLYLGRQVRLANNQSRASARYLFLDAYGQANASIVQSEASASVFRRGLLAEQLSDAESMQFLVLIGQFVNTWSVLFDLHEEGQLPANQWHLVRSDIVAVLTEPGGRVFWDEVGRLNAHPEFVEYVDELISSSEPAYQMVPPNRVESQS